MTEAANYEISKEAAKGPHAGWETYDIQNEGARFHLLQKAISAPKFDLSEAGRLLGELSELAQSYGYGQADSYLNRAGNYTEGDIDDADTEQFLVLKITRDGIFEDAGADDDYFFEVGNSERKLKSAASTPEALAFLGGEGKGDQWDGSFGKIRETMNEAYIRGRDMRADEEVTSPKP